MNKIKLNLTSGVSVEKPLINAFIVNGNKYLVLDNEMNGSMGLPIVLVCKIVDNKVTKILDAAEWNSAKEYLKQIISGGQMEYIEIDSNMSADDIYYTQLTLTVPSFDALKSAYKVLASQDKVTSVPENTTSIQQEQVAPVPVVEESVMNTFETPVVKPTPVVESPMPEVAMPTFEMPSVTPAPVMPTNEVSQPVVEAPVMNAVEPPVVEPTPVAADVFAEQKEAFMEACGNMFDALVQKFEKELRNKTNN